MKASLLSPFATFALLAATAQGATYTIAGTGLFDQSLGTLESVEVFIREGHGTSFPSPLGHTHTLALGSFVPVLTATGLPLSWGTQVDFHPITLSTVGAHTHTATLAPFQTTVGQLIPPAPIVSESGSHSHAIDFSSATADQSGRISLAGTTFFSGGNYRHEVLVPAFSQVFSGDGLTPFLSGNPVATFGPGSATLSAADAHSHQLVAGSYPALLNGFAAVDMTIPASYLTSSIPGHSHSVPISGMGIEQTTFTYDPVPEPAGLGLVGLLGAALLGRPRRPARGVRGA